jgi:hypothetical protein
MHLDTGVYALAIRLLSNDISRKATHVGYHHLLVKLTVSSRCHPACNGGGKLLPPEFIQTLPGEVHSAVLHPRRSRVFM